MHKLAIKILSAAIVGLIIALAFCINELLGLRSIVEKTKSAENLNAKNKICMEDAIKRFGANLEERTTNNATFVRSVFYSPKLHVCLYESRYGRRDANGQIKFISQNLNNLYTEEVIISKVHCESIDECKKIKKDGEYKFEDDGFKKEINQYK